MSTRRVKDAKDVSSGELIYFRGHAKATYLSDGRTVEDAIKNTPSSEGKSTLIKTTYSELKSLKDNKQLVPGCLYRITDYVTTASGLNVGTAGNNFDIIVEALTSGSLNENVSACPRENDTYFRESRVSAWEIKYCLENDIYRFDWADTVNGKGVIYYMKDEFDNECPYDFKNILFNNYYTFSYTILGVVYDGSVKYGNYCFSNVIKNYNINGCLKLNNVVFKNTTKNSSCYLNAFSDFCISITFGDSCMYNTFGEACANISFGDNCIYNTIKNQVSQVTVGNFCSSNTFGNYCREITLGNNCTNNVFKFECCFLEFGNNYSFNTVNDNCHQVKFIMDNAIIDNVVHNTIDSNCRDLNVICKDLVAGDKLQYFKFGQSLTGDVELRGKTVANRLFETKVCYNSKGEIVQYCEADLIMVNPGENIEVITTENSIEFIGDNVNVDENNIVLADDNIILETSDNKNYNLIIE